MKINRFSFLLVLIFLFAFIAIFAWGERGQAQSERGEIWVIGTIQDSLGLPIEDAHVYLETVEGKEILTEAVSQSNGSFSLVLDSLYEDPLVVEVRRAHFQNAFIQLDAEQLNELHSEMTIVLPSITLERELDAAFWLSAVIFLLVLVLIATGVFHNTLATLAGASLLFGISYLGSPLNEGLFIFDFEGAIRYIDWNVIFLIMGMMIIIAVVEGTGIFQWLAYFAYRVSRGNVYLLLPILMLITGVISAFLDNVTTMLLMTPISVQIALSLGISPLALLLPEVMASNVIGVSTLVGTPTNILIGSYGDITFNDFLRNLTPGVFLAFIGLLLYCFYIYRKDLMKAHEGSDILLERLAERGKITRPKHLKKAGWVGLGMLLLFVFGEHIHLLPSVTAVIGATALLLWIRPNIEEMIEAVDWTTLVFFMSLFIVVGAIQEVGLISFIAQGIGNLVGENLILAVMIIIWVSAFLSTVIANIPFTAAMLPVVGFLSLQIPGADSKVLFYCLSIGSAMGGNGSLIGASANMVTAGIAESAGFPITYAYFIKKGLPALIITVALGMIWVLVHFF